MTVPIRSGLYRTFRDLNPDESFIEFEGSTITIPMRARRSPKDPWMDEVVKLEAFMRLEIYPPYINNLGTREFQFTIRDWDLYGKSPMLNQLFYGDPRGKFVVNDKTGFADYVPAIVTFKVNHGFHLTVDGGSDEVRALFGDNRDIEIRELCSHHLRVWSPFAETDNAVPNYSSPNNRIYWQVIPSGRAKKINLTYLRETPESNITFDSALMLFHKKMPNLPGDATEFDINSPQDRARYLLAVAPLNGPSDRHLRATLPVRGFNSMRTQVPGNSVLSSLYRPLDGIEFRIPFNTSLRSSGELGESADKLISKSKSEILKGTIEIRSPSRSLATADQAPGPGMPHDSADFPARITYAINYDIYINKERIVEDQAGIAIAVGATDIPPRDVKVAFEKPHANLVAGRYVEFRSGDCTGMEQIPIPYYRSGLNFGRWSRTVPLDPAELADGSAFQDFNIHSQY